MVRRAAIIAVLGGSFLLRLSSLTFAQSSSGFAGVWSLNRSLSDFPKELGFNIVEVPPPDGQAAPYSTVIVIVPDNDANRTSILHVGLVPPRASITTLPSSSGEPASTFMRSARRPAFTTATASTTLLARTANVPLVGLLLPVSSDDEPLRPGNEVGTSSQIRPIAVPLSVWPIDGTAVTRAVGPGTGASEGAADAARVADGVGGAAGPPQAMATEAMSSTTAVGTPSLPRIALDEGTAAARGCGTVIGAC